MTTEAGCAGVDAETEVSTVVAARAEVERSRRAELDTALDRLEAAGEFTDAQRAVVEQLADRLTRQLVGAPLDRATSPMEAATVRRLFLDGGDGDE